MKILKALYKLAAVIAFGVLIDEIPNEVIAFLVICIFAYGAYDASRNFIKDKNG